MVAELHDVGLFIQGDVEWRGPPAVLQLHFVPVPFLQAVVGQRLKVVGKLVGKKARRAGHPGHVVHPEVTNAAHPAARARLHVRKTRCVPQLETVKGLLEGIGDVTCTQPNMVLACWDTRF